MSHKEDQHYIDAIFDGDARAFSVLVDRYKHMVFTLAAKILKNHQEAEEVAQDVFVKVYMALRTFKGDSKFSTWLYKITYYRSLDELKRKKRGLKTSSIDSDTEFHLSNMENVLDMLETNERKLAIKGAIDELPSDDAVVITLHYFEELSLKEIADIMNIEANTVKVRLFRIRKRLAGLLANKLEPEILGNYGKK